MKAIILIGYMCSGKTTLGKALADALNIPFLDTDTLIETTTKNTIKQLFKSIGETKFRQLELDLLDTLPRENCIISTGGGLPCFNDAINYLNNIGTTVYLKHTPEVLFNRLQTDHNNRPLFNEGLTLQHVKGHLKEREVFYNQAALIVPTQNQRCDYLINQLKYDKLP